LSNETDLRTYLANVEGAYAQGTQPNTPQPARFHLPDGIEFPRKKGRSTITSRGPRRRDSTVLSPAQRETPPPLLERAFMSS
jgi:hypothetical protein